MLKENEAFEKYYTLQKACDSEKEWNQCLEKMKTDLPQSFRLNTSRPQTAKHLQQILKKISNGKVLPKPWPEGEESIIWQFDKLSRWDLKKSSKTEIKFVVFSYAKMWRFGGICPIKLAICTISLHKILSYIFEIICKNS